MMPARPPRGLVDTGQPWSDSQLPGQDHWPPSLCRDGTTPYLYSTRPDGFGRRDFYVATRTELREPKKDDEAAPTRVGG